MDYNELKQAQQKEVNQFGGLFFAFNNEQFKEGIAKVGASEENKVVSIGAGGYILSKELKNFTDMLARHKKELKELKNDNKKLIDAIVYELNNHEYCITYDASDALEALNLKEEEIDKDILKKAIKIYMEKVEDSPKYKSIVE